MAGCGSGVLAAGAAGMFSRVGRVAAGAGVFVDRKAGHPRSAALGTGLLAALSPSSGVNGGRDAGFGGYLLLRLSAAGLAAGGRRDVTGRAGWRPGGGGGGV
jgi:hypothetical protein